MSNVATKNDVKRMTRTLTVRFAAMGAATAFLVILLLTL
jgi:hypothetical protein